MSWRLARTVRAGAMPIAVTSPRASVRDGVRAPKHPVPAAAGAGAGCMPSGGRATPSRGPASRGGRPTGWVSGDGYPIWHVASPSRPPQIVSYRSTACSKFPHTNIYKVRSAARENTCINNGNFESLTRPSLNHHIGMSIPAQQRLQLSSMWALRARHHTQPRALLGASRRTRGLLIYDRVRK